MIGDSSGKDYEKPCVTDTSVKKDHNVAVIAAARRDMGVRRGRGEGKSRLYKDATHLMQNERGLRTYIQGVSKKTLFYVLANISANTYSRETSRISTELAWQEASNNMRLDFLRYLVHEKIDILGEIILTLIALQVFHHFACVVKINREILLPWIQLYLNTG